MDGGEGDGTFHTVEKVTTLWAIAAKTLATRTLRKKFL